LRIKGGGDDHRQNGVCFGDQVVQEIGAEISKLGDHFEPEDGFIGLFFTDAQFGTKLGGASGPTCGSIVRSNRGSTSK
jgi:hypothetical protein